MINKIITSSNVYLNLDDEYLFKVIAFIFAVQLFGFWLSSGLGTTPLFFGLRSD